MLSYFFKNLIFAFCLISRVSTHALPEQSQSVDLAESCAADTRLKNHTHKKHACDPEELLDCAAYWLYYEHQVICTEKDIRVYLGFNMKLRYTFPYSVLCIFLACHICVAV